MKPSAPPLSPQPCPTMLANSPGSCFSPASTGSASHPPNNSLGTQEDDCTQMDMPGCETTQTPGDDEEEEEGVQKAGAESQKENGGKKPKEPWGRLMPFAIGKERLRLEWREPKEGEEVLWEVVVWWVPSPLSQNP